MSIRYTSDQLQRKFPGPAGSPGYARVADALRAEGRLDEAVSLCREGLRARPQVAGYVVLGKALVDAGRLEEAREQFEAALRVDPRCLAALRALAGIMDKLQWADAAAGYYRSILEVEPWDAEIRALLEGAASAGSGAGSAPAGAVPSAPSLPGRDEDTFAKPEGLQGDVLEVNLNDMADAVLPSGDASDASLEDALADRGPAAGDFSPAPDPAGDPKPMDLLSAATGPETLGENAPAPISGSDVEERLDSLFGQDDGGTSATATWTAAVPPPDALPEASATAAGELRAPESAPELPGEAAPFDLAEVPDAFAAPAPADEAMGKAAPGSPAPPEGDAADGDARVQGEDIERRLDELFQLTGEEERPKPALSASDLPVAPGPKIGEAVAMGESVAFGDRFASAVEPPSGEIVTGQDVADKLDSLLGPEPQAKGAAAPETGLPSGAAAPSAPKGPFADLLGPLAEPAPAAEPPVGLSGPIAPEAGPSAEEPGSETVFAEDGPARGAHPEAPGLPLEGEALLSTESLSPAAWPPDAPQVTGADVEAQLDKLFNLEPAADEAAAPAVPEAAPETAARAVPDIPPQGNPDDTVTLVEPAAGDAPAERPRLRESVADWLARREDQEGPAAGDTLILPNEGMFPADDAAGRPGEAAFGTLASEDFPDLSGTASIEMVDGGDVAERLDKLFADAPAEAPEPEIDPSAFAEPLPEPDATLEVPVSRLAEPGTPDGAEDALSHPLTADAGLDPDARGPKADVDAAGAGRIAPELAPMLDEEEGYPEEEEMPAQGAGANVATVTLAEIYFQQGLKEQALQIYRQLLEREPENESVRKRIAEIEASKAEGDRGPGSDPRWPRPGLKVPKRKK